MFLTSPDEPHLSISKLSLKNENANNVWYGNYRLVGNKVSTNEIKPKRMFRLSSDSVTTALSVLNCSS